MTHYVAFDIVRYYDSKLRTPTAVCFPAFMTGSGLVVASKTRALVFDRKIAFAEGATVEEAKSFVEEESVYVRAIRITKL